MARRIAPLEQLFAFTPCSTTTRGITHPPERSAIPRSALTTLFGGVVFRILLRIPFTLNVVDPEAVDRHNM
jgi:hypothetical protein